MQEIFAWHQNVRRGRLQAAKELKEVELPSRNNSGSINNISGNLITPASAVYDLACRRAKYHYYLAAHSRNIRGGFLGGAGDIICMCVCVRRSQTLAL